MYDFLFILIYFLFYTVYILVNTLVEKAYSPGVDPIVFDNDERLIFSLQNRCPKFCITALRLTSVETNFHNP